MEQPGREDVSVSGIDGLVPVTGPVEEYFDILRRGRPLTRCYFLEGKQVTHHITPDYVVAAKISFINMDFYQTIIIKSRRAHNDTAQDSVVCNDVIKLARV